MHNPAKPKIATLFFACATLAMTIASAQANESERESRSTAGAVRERTPDSRRDPLKLAPNVKVEITPKHPAASRLNSAEKLAAICCAFRVYSANTELFDDFDGDGYYTYLRVSFDVDTDFSAADVYADLYLAGPGEPWELFFESDVFTVFGSSPDDDYEVETEFVGGYPPGDYDLLIEIFDAVTGEFVASYGPADSSRLSYLPIEDIDFDSESDSQVFVSARGSSLSLMSLALLAAAIKRRSRKRVQSTD